MQGSKDDPSKKDQQNRNVESERNSRNAHNSFDQVADETSSRLQRPPNNNYQLQSSELHQQLYHQANISQQDTIQRGNHREQAPIQESLHNFNNLNEAIEEHKQRIVSGGSQHKPSEDEFGGMDENESGLPHHAILHHQQPFFQANPLSQLPQYGTAQQAFQGSSFSIPYQAPSQVNSYGFHIAGQAPSDYQQYQALQPQMLTSYMPTFTLPQAPQNLNFSQMQPSNPYAYNQIPYSGFPYQNTHQTYMAPMTPMQSQQFQQQSNSQFPMNWLHQPSNHPQFFQQAAPPQTQLAVRPQIPSSVNLYQFAPPLPGQSQATMQQFFQQAAPPQNYPPQAYNPKLSKQGALPQIAPHQFAQPQEESLHAANPQLPHNAAPSQAAPYINPPPFAAVYPENRFDIVQPEAALPQPPQIDNAQHYGHLPQAPQIGIDQPQGPLPQAPQSDIAQHLAAPPQAAPLAPPQVAPPQANPHVLAAPLAPYHQGAGPLAVQPQNIQALPPGQPQNLQANNHFDVVRFDRRQDPLGIAVNDIAQGLGLQLRREQEEFLRRWILNDRESQNISDESWVFDIFNREEATVIKSEEDKEEENIEKNEYEML